MPRPMRLLALVPVAAAAFPAVMALRLGDPAALAGAYYAASLLDYSLAATGAGLAALAFSRGDWLRRAWGLLAASYALLLPTRLLRTPSFVPLPGEAAPHPLGYLLGIASALTGLAAILMLGTTWRRAGLPLPGSRAGRTAARVAALVLGLAVVGPALSEELRAAAGGTLDALEAAAASIHDLVTFWVAVQLMWTGYVLRGGVAAWPWTWLTAGTSILLVYDAWGTGFPGASAELVRSVDEILRGGFAGCIFAAGLSQRVSLSAEPERAPR